MKKVVYSVAGFLGAAMIAGGSGVSLAAPIAPHPPLSKIGREMLAAQPGKNIHQCPEAALVAMPVYRGALCVTNVTTSINGKQAPIEMLVLVSRAAPETVRHWYAQHLSGWQYDPRLHHFVRPGWALDHFLDEPSVHVVKATGDRPASRALPEGVQARRDAHLLPDPLRTAGRDKTMNPAPIAIAWSIAARGADAPSRLK